MYKLKIEMLEHKKKYVHDLNKIYFEFTQKYRPIKRACELHLKQQKMYITRTTLFCVRKIFMSFL